MSVIIKSCNAFSPVMVRTGRTTHLEICARVWNSWQTQYESQLVSSLHRVRPSPVRSPIRQDQLPTTADTRLVAKSLYLRPPINELYREKAQPTLPCQLYELTLFDKTMLLLIRTGSFSHLAPRFQTLLILFFIYKIVFKYKLCVQFIHQQFNIILHGRLNKISAKLKQHSSTQWLVQCWDRWPRATYYHSNIVL